MPVPLDIDRPSLPVPRRHRRRRGGFALLITVTLLAFLVLLLVSLATLTRVETQVASNSQQLAQARQNALMALNLALGQLQKYTGPDQRVTAPADIASAADGTRLPAGSPAQNTASVNGTVNGLAPSGATASVQTGTRWWTGVWGRAGSSYATPAKSIYEETPSPVLLNWLVSGNEDRAFTTDADGLVKTSTADGRTAAATPPFTPGAPVNWSGAGLDTANPSGWSAANYARLEIKTSGQKAVLLVGPRTAGTDPSAGGEAAAERYVVAPLENIAVPSASVPGADATGTTTVGRYAWWVGDEGVKADYTLADPNAGRTTPATDYASRLRLMAAARSGVELVTGFSAYPQADDTSAALKLGRILQMPQAPLLDATLPAETQRFHFHDFAAGTSGVLSDTLAGGLRQDLTYYFESPSHWNASPLKGQGIIPSDYSPNWGSLGYAPKWDWLYSFYNTNPDASSASPSLQVRPETATEVGISPVITQFRMLVFTDPDQPVPSVNINNMPLPGGDYSVPVRCNVAFVLANPYNVTLDIPANTYEFAVKNTYTGSGQPAMPSPSDSKSIPPGLIIFASDTGHAVNASYGTFVFMRDTADSVNPSMLDEVRFIVPAVSIPPGGNCVLSVKGASQIAGAGSSTAPAPGAEDPVNLEVNTVSNPIGGTSAYFTAKTSLNFTAPAPTGTTPSGDPVTTSRVVINFYVHDSVALTTTLRRTSDQVVLQQLTDCGFSKKGLVALGSKENNIIGNFHTTFLPPAWRNMDSSTTAAKFYNALLAYARPYQDLNLRAALVDHPAVDNGQLWTPPSYGGGSARSGSMSEAGNFTQDLTPATWAENFGTGTTVDPDGGATRGPVASQGVLFDFPRRVSSSQPPVLSLGALQHASLTADDWHPGHTINNQSGYAIGNSYSAPFVTRGSSVQSRASKWYKTSGNIRFFDLAYLLNTALWDGYYFSGVPQSGSTFASLNPRYAIYDDATASDVRSSDAAAHLLTRGAFNINSTSVAAWTALLGGLDTLRVNDDSASDSVPYPRTIWQPAHNTQTGSSYTSSGTGDDAYAGYRRLSSSEIASLAAEIVKRVRARGPFVSLSHFINRSLVAASADFNPSINDADTSGHLAATPVPMGRGLSGPLQAAIDSAAAGINTFQSVGGKRVTPDGAGAYGDRMLFAGEILSTSAQKPSMANNGPVYFADTRVDLPNLDPTYDNPAPVPPGPQGRTSTGIPGWLLQGDLLQALGPTLSARSDTFVIRAYGEVVNPVDSTQVSARAWCEAVVQRLPAYVDPSDTPQTAPASLSSSVNKTFGRAYKIVSFRWLTPEDI